MYIEESKLEKLLIKAYEEGWYGSKDLAQEASSKIIANFQDEQTQNKKQKKKSLKKVKIKASTGPWANYVNTGQDRPRPQYARSSSDEEIPQYQRPPSEEELRWHRDQADRQEFNRRNSPADQSEDWHVDASGRIYGRPPITTYREHRRELDRQIMESMSMPTSVRPGMPMPSAPVEETPHDNASASSQSLPLHHPSSAEVIQGMLFGNETPPPETIPNQDHPPLEMETYQTTPGDVLMSGQFPSVAEEMEMSEGDIQDWAEESEEAARMEAAALRFSADHPTNPPQGRPRASQEELDDARAWGGVEISFEGVNDYVSMSSTFIPTPETPQATNPIIRHEGWSDNELFTWMDGSVHNMPESQGGG